MATLPSNDLNEVWAQVMSDFSVFSTLIPVNKNQLKTLLVAIDSEMETAEVNLFAAIPPGAAKDWLLANLSIGRDLIQRVEQKRQEVL